MNSAALSRPFAWVIWAMKISRISACAGSTSTVSRRRAARCWPCRPSCPALSRVSLTVSATTRLPATRIGQSTPEWASMRALCVITLLSPPSVPPHRRMMSHRAASISRTTSLSISKPYEQTSFGAGAQTGPAGRFQGQLGHQADGRHLQAAGRAAAGVLALDLPQIEPARVDELGERAVQADGDVGVDGGRRLGPAQNDFVGEIDGQDLGVGAPEVDQQVDAHRAVRQSMPRSVFKACTASSAVQVLGNARLKPISVKRRSISGQFFSSSMGAATVPPT